MNDKICILENNIVALWAYPERKIIHHMMKARCHGDTFREMLSTGTEALVQYKATKWLSDDRGNSAVLAEDADWALTVWFPRTQAAGWKYWSVVQPAKVIGQMNMSRFVRDSARLGIIARMFSDPDQAFTWLDAAV